MWLEMREFLIQLPELHIYITVQYKVPQNCYKSKKKNTLLSNLHLLEIKKKHGKVQTTTRVCGCLKMFCRIQHE